MLLKNTKIFYWPLKKKNLTTKLAVHQSIEPAVSCIALYTDLKKKKKIEEWNGAVSQFASWWWQETLRKFYNFIYSSLLIKIF